MQTNSKISLWTRIKLVRKISKRLKQMPNINFMWIWYGSDNPKDDLPKHNTELVEAAVGEITTNAIPDLHPGDWCEVHIIRHVEALESNWY